ncbi:MAG: hypothetical protein ABIH38_01465 [Patescibacteria group bacterium]
MSSIIEGLVSRDFATVSAKAMAETPLRAFAAGVNGGCDCDGDCGQNDCDCPSGPDQGDDPGD